MNMRQRMHLRQHLHMRRRRRKVESATIEPLAQFTMRADIQAMSALQRGEPHESDTDTPDKTRPAKDAKKAK